MAFANEGVGDGNAEIAGQMVVAGAREAKPVIGDRAWLVALRNFDRGDGLDALQHPGNQR